jgi:hypothetical protein
MEKETFNYQLINMPGNSGARTIYSFWATDDNDAKRILREEGREWPITARLCRVVERD